MEENQDSVSRFHPSYKMRNSGNRLHHVHIRFLLLSCSILFLASCGREAIEPLAEPPAPFTENTFTYDLDPGVLEPDSLDLMDFIELRDGTTLVFQDVSAFAGDVQPGDLIFLPQATGQFHLTRMAFRVTEVEAAGGFIEIETEEPLLKDIYAHFYLEVNNERDIQFRDPAVDWTNLADSTINELKILDLTLINIDVPAGPNTTVTFKLGNLNAKMDFQYRFQTEYDGAQNALLNFEIGLRNIMIKDFAFTSEMEVKRSNMSSPEDAAVSFLGLSAGEVQMVRLPTPILQAVGIPLVLNVDFAETIELALAGKAVLETNFGTLLFTGDPLVIRYDFFTLEDAAWTAVSSAFGMPSIGALVSQFDNIQLVSYPDDFTISNATCPVKFTVEMSGVVKPSLTLGISLSPPAYTSVAIGAYTDIFLEAVGKVTTDICLDNSGATFTPGACVEVNWGLKLPYFMATKVSAGLDIFSYEAFKIAFLGEVKNNIFKYPADCNPFDFVDLVNGVVEAGSSCGTDQRPFINVTVIPPELIAQNEFYRMVLDGQIIDNLPYHIQNSFYLDEHGLGATPPLTELNYEIVDVTTGKRIRLGKILTANCSTEGCTILIDEDLPTYGPKEYCVFTPNLPGYTRQWIRDNMFYTSRPSGFDPFEDGRCYDDVGDNCVDFGRLYTWHAANGPRRNTAAPFWEGTDICPIGYHVPSKEEWEELINAAGGQGANAVLSHESWPGLFDIDRNLSGFSAYPFGFFVPGSNAGQSGFQGLGNDAYFWTSTEIVGITGTREAAWAVHMTKEGGVEIVPAVKTLGMSCRCIRDN